MPQVLPGEQPQQRQLQQMPKEPPEGWPQQQPEQGLSGKEEAMESECGLPPPWSSEEGSHSDSDTPLRPAPKRMGPAVHHQDLQGVPVQLVLGRSPYRAAMIGGTHPPGSEGGNVLTQFPALDEGPAGDIGLLFNADP